MIATIEKDKETYQIDLSKALDLSIPLRASPDNPSAWYVDPPRIEAVRSETFTGSVKEGGSVNFRNIFFNPHGHGTHTECVGHISEEIHSINQNLKQFFFWAELVSVQAELQENKDQVITAAQLKKTRKHKTAEALIIRTLPNNKGKLSAQYSNTNPAYVEAQAVQEMIESGIQHLLLDLPSVDRENDGGKLSAHHTFWEHPKNTQMQRTITEMIFVPNEIKDGLYLLNLQIAPFENDASPSKPILYALSRTQTNEALRS
ncbi:MAG: cyclase family protein [Vicingaceae bacterium]